MMDFILDLDFKLIAIFSALFGALSNIVARVLLKEYRSYDVMGLSFLMVGSTLLLVSPLFYHFEPSWITIGLLYLIGIIDAGANYFYFKTFEKTESSIATSVLSLTPAFSFIGAWVFLDENTPILHIIIAFLIIFLIALFSVDFKDFRNSRKNTLWPAFYASVLYGISAIPSKMLLDKFNAINAPTLYMFRATIIGMIAFIFMRPNLQNLPLKSYRLIWFQGILAIITWVSLYYALSKGNTGITITLSNISPVFTVFLGYLFLREKITFRKGILILLILILSSLITFF